MRERTFAQGILTVTRLREDRLLSDREMDAALRRGHAEVDFCIHNHIVDIGLSVFSRLLGNNAGNPLVGGSGFADLGAITVGRMDIGRTVVPAVPADGDTVGVATLAYVPALVVSYPTDFSVKFSGLIPTTECNSFFLTEEALRLQNGMLFARTTFNRSKNSSFALQFDHLIEFARL